MMQFNSTLLRSCKAPQNLSLAQDFQPTTPTPEFSFLQTLVQNLRISRIASHLTPLSVPRYIDSITSTGMLEVTENFQD